MNDTLFRPLEDAWPFRDRTPRRLVIKLGSNLLSTPKGLLDESRIRAVAEQIARLRAAGTQVIIVTSGAVASGMGVMGLDKRPLELPSQQALASIGQGQLMGSYIDAFRPFNLVVGQILLTRGDLEDRQRYLNAEYTLETLLGMNVIPVINENDSVITEELTLGDNDMLSAVIAVKLNAELLAILTDIDGLYTANPRTDSSARLLTVVDKVTHEIEQLAQGPGSIVGRGGMMTKVAAAHHATSFGVAALIANGRTPGIVDAIASGKFTGTLFLPRERNGRGRSRAHWISMRRPRGVVVIDDGARRALVEMNRSLLPVGVVAVNGEFEKGDVIAVHDGASREVARGITNYGTHEVSLLKGLKGAAAAEALGTRPPYEELIHRNNLLVKG